MRKLMLANQLHSLLLPSLLPNIHFPPGKPLLSFFTSFFTFFQNRAYSATPHLNLKNSVLADYLVNSLKFPEISSLKISNKLLHVKSLERPKTVVYFFKALGFSDMQIQSSVSHRPRILLADVEKNLKPKVLHFQELGLSGPLLAVFITKAPNILFNNLDKSLRPRIELLKKVLKQNSGNISNDDINDNIFYILLRSRGFIGKDSQLLSSITYLESCGIVGSQLIMLLKNELKLFLMCEGKLRALVSRVTEFGFVMGSHMLVYGVLVLFCTTLKLDKSVVVSMPVYLTMSMEKRVIPRYRVLKLIKSRRLLDRDPRFTSVLFLSNVKFAEKYILRFAYDAKELLAAYEGSKSLKE